jgi:hypothetical protein
MSIAWGNVVAVEVRRREIAVLVVARSVSNNAAPIECAIALCAWPLTALQAHQARVDDIGAPADPDCVSLGSDVDPSTSSHCSALRGDVRC